eukprot:m.43261 g.43261  ORF g.43261 m.43261 type:complete len:562 (-) comp19333_c1_seq1:250-1935(-)
MIRSLTPTAELSLILEGQQLSKKAVANQHPTQDVPYSLDINANPRRIQSHPQSNVNDSRRRSIDFNPNSSVSRNRNSLGRTQPFVELNGKSFDSLSQNLFAFDRPERCTSSDSSASTLSTLSSLSDDDPVQNQFGVVNKRLSLQPLQRRNSAPKRGIAGKLKGRRARSLSFEGERENLSPSSRGLIKEAVEIQLKAPERQRSISEDSPVRRNRTRNTRQSWAGAGSDYDPRPLDRQALRRNNNTDVVSNSCEITTSRFSSFKPTPVINTHDTSDDEPESERKHPQPTPMCLSSTLSPTPGMHLAFPNDNNADDDNDDNCVLLPDGPNIRGDRRARCVLPTTNTFHRFDRCIRMVSPNTVNNLLEGNYRGVIDEFLIVDSRFPFEHDGGHIQGAVNYWNIERAVHRIFVDHVVKPNNKSRTVIIFHCEFSSVRAPTMLKAIRTLDDELTQGQNGSLFPELYIMEGGYSTFFKQHMSKCTPQTYTKMKDKRFVQENCQHESIMRKSWIKTTGNDNYSNFPGLSELKESIQNNGVSGRLTFRSKTPECPSHMVSPRTPASQVLN